MDRTELKRIIAADGLRSETTCFLDETSIREDAVVLEPRGSEWAVYLTDERAGMWESTLRVFAEESDALEHMLHKLRQGAEVRRPMATRRSVESGS